MEIIQKVYQEDETQKKEANIRDRLTMAEKKKINFRAT